MPRIKILASLIISSFALTACNSDTEVLDVEENKLYTSSRIQFDPSGGILSLPNDLLFSGTTDGTLQLPDETAAIEAASGAVITYDDNTYAIGALDGWSTIQPIVIGVDLYEDRTLDASSITQEGAVRIIPVMLGGAISLSSDANCKGAPSLSVCGVTGPELEYGNGKDFITAVNGTSIVIIPLKPFAENASYMYLTTDLIKDSAGESVNGSVTYQLIKKDFAESPIGDPSNAADAAAVGLQKLVNHYDADIITALGIDASTVTSTGVFTTQSETDVINILKTVMAAADAGAPAYTAYKPGVPAALTITVADANAAAAAVGFAPLSTTIELPYYLKTESKSSYWTALGDSPITILGAYAASPTTVGLAVTTNCPSANLAIPATLVGCNIGLDPFKHLTRFNPLVTPVVYNAKPSKTVEVQITIPQSARPADGYPVNISLHGLGTLKETTLATAKAFADQGIATIAIDMPLHGSRGVDYLLADGSPGTDGIYDISATDAQFGASYANGTALDFINIESGLTVRDNFRQAIADLLALRLQIAEFTDGAVIPQTLFDPSKVSMHGLSLGAITGSSFAAYANDATLVDHNPLDGTPETPANDLYGLKTVSLVAPTGGLASVFNDSATFGPMLMDELVKTVVTAQAIASGATDEEAATQAKGVVDFKDNATAAEYAAAQKYAEDEIVESLLFSIQTQVDPIDPINIAAKLAANTAKLHVIEIVGDGMNNKSDQVLPNGNGVTLTGTETLIKLLELGCLDPTSTASTAGAVRFSKGHHSSLIQASGAGATFAGVTDEDAVDARIEMQTQVVTFAEGASAAAMTGGNILISNTDVISPCPAS
ncbi:hypothetical protein PE36_10373 [Moritella sp. PE36]|uniref:VolA/Pla-1 family phospholipase n=1 Tax=Moritella sp. PE36 TaxID=58051 RepID=UPI0001568CCB|nr:VolA/Pla-1 family phospholipase [Moritella sp. PE36]EDM64725.1 hypothetical protein PE36_10373 [Moritella sp. PE36]